MSDTLLKIAELEGALRTDAPIVEAERWWSMVVAIESTLQFDARQPQREKRLLEQLRKSVSDAIRQIREGWPSPTISSVLVASGALKASVERRTIGPDGWPMGR